MQAEKLLSSAPGGGPPPKMTLVDVSGAGGVMNKLAPDKRKAVQRELGDTLKKFSVANDSAAVLGDDKFGLVHDAAVDPSVIQRGVADVLKRAAPAATRRLGRVEQPRARSHRPEPERHRQSAGLCGQPVRRFESRRIHHGVAEGRARQGARHGHDQDGRLPAFHRRGRLSAVFPADRRAQRPGAASSGGAHPACPTAARRSARSPSPKRSA
ncbi:MAG: hypothetical protein WDO24_08535 [Pseudomonadota bacterium]